LAARRLEVRLRSVCDAGRQRDGSRALGLFNGGERAETAEAAFRYHAGVPLHMTIVDLFMFLVIFAGMALGIAYFGVGFSADRNVKRQR
jgi:hypothetical protein